MPGQNVYSVGEITAYLKARFAEDALLSDVWLSGEVSNFKQHTSGHCYLTLKDANASIRAVIWRTTAQRLTLPRDGDAVTAHGYISVYEAQGVYQLYVDDIRAAGAGRLWLEFERLRGRLEAEGLFSPERKRPLPARPERLGVVTSATGAALRDILRTLASRYPLVDVLLAPAVVQGEQGPPTIVAALALLNRWSAEREPLDAIILARGGGSIEELWAFNDERVARAIVASAVPVVTGVGHETDFTIADFAADQRAATPTAAAALVTPDGREIAADVAALRSAAAQQLAQQLAAARQNLEHLAHRVRRAAPDRIHARRQRVHGIQLQMAALDVNRVLSRGYAIITRPDGAVVASVGQVSPGDAIRARLADGSFDATVTS
ncbi:MAG: Exodeoxyribonuclease 7 large subunit [Chloroflexi bacterium ADurb.Bin325]|nr:MAG: Exodeoxyribonuclease 7 large subunit [Chloroflexi bacterium ADurb.Bin325]